MKKILLVLACLAATIALCACGGEGGGLFSKPTPTPVPEIDPAVLITPDDVASVAGYLPVTEPSGTDREGNVATVLYRSESLGAYDTVEVKVTQFTDDIEYQQIFDIYESQKAKRTSAMLIEGMGQEAYIAYPTIHVYDRGCLIEITAGSGAGEVQKNILTSLGMKAAGKLEEIIPEYKPE